MKITLTSTDTITAINGQPCRIWTGETERGVRLMAFIPRLAVEREEDTSQFQAELLDAPPPREIETREAFRSFSARMF